MRTALLSHRSPIRAAALFLLCAALLLTLPFSPAIAAADGEAAALPFTPRLLDTLMNAALRDAGMRSELTDSGAAPVVTVFREEVVKAEIRFEPALGADAYPERLSAQIMNIDSSGDGYFDGVTVMDAIISACEPLLSGEERSYPILTLLDGVNIYGVDAQAFGEGFRYGLNSAWVFTAEPGSGEAGMEWPDEVSFGGWTIRHWSDSGMDYFRVHTQEEPIGVPTFYYGPDDVFTNSGDAKNVSFIFFRRYDAASVKQADVFCRYLRQLSPLNNFASRETFGDLEGRDGVIAVLFASGWDLDGYTRPLQALTDWSPWTNPEGVQLRFVPVDEGDAVESRWDEITGELGCCHALWLQRDSYSGGVTVALGFTGADGSALSLYVPEG